MEKLSFLYGILKQKEIDELRTPEPVYALWEETIS